MTLTGLYNRHGYVIVDDATEQALYYAGNNPWESSSCVPLHYGLPLRTIKKFCIRTGKEMAKEMDAIFTGAYRGDE